MDDIIQARDWLKRGFKVSNEMLLEGDHYYLKNPNSDESILMFDGPGWDPEAAKFEFEDLNCTSWFVLKEETLSDKVDDKESKCPNCGMFCTYEEIYYKEKDLKDTIEKVKEEIDETGDLRDVGSFDRAIICDIIDKHFGERLI